MKQNLDKAKEILNTIKGNFCIHNMTYQNNIVSCLLDFHHDMDMSVFNKPYFKVNRVISNRAIDLIIYLNEYKQ